MTPSLSVVLPVFNGAAHLSGTITSLLGQTQADFELIIIDDGSTDATPTILAQYAERDTRIRVLTQRNQGLTRALIHGCGTARAPLIARQDCGDISHPDRLRRMSALLAENPSCVVAGCDVTYIGPEGEKLYTTRHAARDVRTSLLEASIDEILSLPNHGTAVMRADAFRRAGGYRAAFYFAQDLDLWIRMAALGDICIAADVLYEARLDVGDISSVHRAEQLTSAAAAIALRDATTEEERDVLLRKVAVVRPRAGSSNRGVDAKALYFIASCLQTQNDPRWRRYATRALRRDPMSVRSWLLLLRGVVT